MARRQQPRSKRPGEPSDEELIAQYIATKGVTKCPPRSCDGTGETRYSDIASRTKHDRQQSIFCSKLFRPEPPERKEIFLDIMIIKKRKLDNEPTT
jgi:hypothetical protein